MPTTISLALYRDAKDPAAQQACRDRQVAIREYVSHYFDRKLDRDGKYPAVPRIRFPNFARLLEAYLESVVELATGFTPKLYEKLCVFLLDDFLLREGFSLGGRDLLLPTYRKGLALVEAQDAEALEHWRRQVIWHDSFHDSIYRVTRKTLEQLLLAYDIQKDSDDWEVAMEAFHLMFAARLQPDTLVNDETDPDADLTVILPEELTPVSDHNDNIRPLPTKHCPTRGGLRLVTD